MKIRRLTTSGEIIDECGGTVAFGKLIKRTKQQVSNHRGSNTLPPKSYLVVMAELKKRHCTADPSIFGMSEPGKASAA
jgi:hypothetical protein